MKSLSFLTFLSADSSLGRVDKHSLSQQTLMELLTEGFTRNKERICGKPDNIKDISEWKGLTFNASKDISKISWRESFLAGFIDLQWIPPSAKAVDLTRNNLNGTVDLTCLPEGFEILYLSTNKFSGTLDLTRLPGKMMYLSLDSNNFCGSADFSQFPNSLVFLNVSNTQIRGEVRKFRGMLHHSYSNVKDMRRR